MNDPALIDQLSGLPNPPRVKAEVVLKSEPDYIQMSTQPLECGTLSFNRDSIAMTISGPSALNMEVPKDSRTPHLRPGIYNLL